MVPKQSMATEEDGVLDSWEDLEDSGELDKRLEDMRPKPQKENKKITVLQRPNASAPSISLQEDSCRTAYQPQVKILKRQPNSDPGTMNSNRTNQAARPMKSLEQREAEYAEARLRILGSATYDQASPPSPTQPPPLDTRPARLARQIEEMHLTDNVVRQPHGPDGSRGFAERSQPR